MKLVDEITRLRSEGLSYRQIEKELGCSKSTISYHLSEGQKQKTNNRRVKFRIDNPLSKKLDQFKDKSRNTYVFAGSSSSFEKAFRDKVGDFQKMGKEYNTQFGTSDVLEKIGDSPACYLTGRKIDLQDTRSYHLDHIVPRSKGGDNSLENLGLADRHANIAKSNLSIEELLQLCEDILTHNGYEVSKMDGNSVR